MRDRILIGCRWSDSHQRSNPEHNLSPWVSMYAGLVGPACLRQRKHLINYGLHRSRVDQATDLAQLLTAGLDYEVDEAHVRSRRWVRLRWGDDRDQNAARPQHLPRPSQSLTTHQIKDDIQVLRHVLKTSGG